MQNWFWLALAAFSIFMFMQGSLPAAAKLSPGEVRDAVASQKDLQLIDVRTPAENKEARLAGSKLIPLNELPSRLGELSKDKPLIVYCRSGNRSGQALKLLFKNGFKQAQHLEGGIIAWQAAGLPVTR